MHVTPAHLLTSLLVAGAGSLAVAQDSLVPTNLGLRRLESRGHDLTDFSVPLRGRAGPVDVLRYAPAPGTVPAMGPVLTNTGEVRRIDFQGHDLTDTPAPASRSRGCVVCATSATTSASRS